ncbi:hypothetical protein F4680DRAFT_469426 [Xylaria scruposa]|nr:hypothetical protein F4680DRAFT_469426 [Xylaria scruposa]
MASSVSEPASPTSESPSNSQIMDYLVNMHRDLDTIKRDIATIKRDVGGMQQSIKTLIDRQDKHDIKMDTLQSSIEDLTKRVQKLERGQKATDNEVHKLAHDLKNFASDIESLNSTCESAEKYSRTHQTMLRSHLISLETLLRDLTNGGDDAVMARFNINHEQVLRAINDFHIRQEAVASSSAQ